MMIDYKLWYIKRDDDGFITEAAIWFYEGDFFVGTETDRLTFEKKSVTKYIRTKRLGLADLGFVSSKKAGIEQNGSIAAVYGQEDFGKIKTDDELRSFLNKELAKKQKVAIPEQRI